MHGDSEAGRLLLALDPDKYKGLSAGYSATEEQVEQVIMRAYGSQNIKGKQIGLGREIGIMDDRMLRSLVDHGPSALRNTEFYSRSNTYKIFKEKGAFDFSLGSQMEDLVDKYKNALDPGLYGKIKNALSITDETIKKQTLTELINNNQNDRGLEALLTNSVFRKMETAALEQENILGVYVNRSATITSTFDQFDDYMQEIINTSGISDELKKILGKDIAFLGQETAIDAATNYSSSVFKASLRDSRGKLQNVSNLISRAILMNGDEAAIEAAAIQALGLSGDMNLNKVGAKDIEGLGIRMGSATALMRSQEFGGQFDASLRPVIDQILLEDRFSDGDIEILFNNIQKGIKDAKRAQTLTGAELDQLEENLLKTKLSPSEMRSALSTIFGASKDHKYASVAKLNQDTAGTAAQFNLVKKLSLTNMPQDSILSATNISDDARRVAQFLLDKHTEDYQNVTARLLNESAEYEKLLADEGRYRLGQKIYEDITGAQKITGLSKEEIINAVDKVSAERASLNRQREFDLSRLYYSDDENFAGQVRSASSRRRAAALKVTAGDLEEQVLNNLTSSKRFTSITSPDQTMGAIQEYFENMIGSTSISSEERYLAQAAIGQVPEGASLEEAELARQRARVVTTQASNQVLQQDQATMQALTATGKSTFTGDDNLRKSINAALNGEDYTKYLGAKGKYVRFSEYLKSGQLKNLFKNNNLFKNSIYATGALIVGSFAYQGFKDHTPEKMQGPPMLPGGSAYENQYPSRASEIPQMGTVSYNPGVSYKVNLYGNRNQVTQFQDMAMGLGNFDMDTTMYSGIPQVGTDPYQQLASSY